MAAATLKPIMLSGAVLALLLTLPSLGLASDSQLEEAALKAGCVPSRVDEMAKSDDITSWLIHCAGESGEKIVVTCQKTICRTESAQDRENDDRLR